MKKYFINIIFIALSIHLNAQNEKNELIINLDGLSKDKIYSIQSKGWVLITYNKTVSLANFSNKNYMLHFPVHCKNESQKPSFLIEFSNNYRDGNYGGLDFASSKSDNFKKILFLIDEKEFENPFKNFNKNTFERFIVALKKGKLLKIKFFDNEYNPETNKDELDLNREIDFMLVNSQLLDISIDCKQ